MGKKSTPVAPAPPNPWETAAAQSQYNTQAAITQSNLNRINQYTPQGSLTYSQDGFNYDGTPQWSQHQTYSPEQQALYDQQNQVAQSLGGLAQDNIGRVASAQSTPFNFNGMQPLQAASGAGNNLQYGFGNTNVQSNVGDAGGIQNGYDRGGNIQYTFGQGGPLTSSANGGDIQSSLNYGAEFNPGDFNDTSKAAANAVYSQAQSRLDPQYQQMESDMRSRLLNSGISENSDAFRREMENFAHQRSDAYNQANYSSIAAGLAAQQQGYGQALNTRQQRVGETTTQGNFFNNAQNQRFNQSFSNAQLNNAAQGQQYQQNLNAGQFFNQAQAQANQQNASQAAFGNQAQDQRYNQNLSNASFYNQAQGQIFGQNQSQAAFNNQAQNQYFNQDLAQSQQNNQLRQQQIQESSYLRNLPLNDIAALLGTGGGVQGPQFNPFAQVGVAAPDYQGAVGMNYNAAMQQYTQQMQARSTGLGSIFGALGSLGGAGIMASDERLKHGIQRIGTLANGLATYVFSYAGDTVRHFGVMAQEALKVLPDAVITGPNGYMAVDYRKVWQ